MCSGSPVSLDRGRGRAGAAAKSRASGSCCALALATLAAGLVITGFHTRLLLPAFKEAPGRETVVRVSVR
jgi:hypothetical protein